MTENRVQTLDRSLDILEELAKSKSPLGVTEIGKRVGLSKSTVHRILQTLCWRGYIEKNEEHYCLGLKIVELGSTLLNDLDIRKIAGPILEQAATTLEEAVHLVLYDSGEVVYIDTKGSSQKIINMYSKVGRRAPIHATAVGKAMLSFLPENKLEEIISKKGLYKITEKTITNKEEFLRHLGQVRKEKVAYDDEENEVGIYCIGTPVFDYSGNIIGGVSVSGPATRIKEKGLKETAAIVKKIGEEVSTRMGFLPGKARI